MLTQELLVQPAMAAMEGVEDLEPTPEGAARTWTWSVFAGAWATMSHDRDGWVEVGNYGHDWLLKYVLERSFTFLRIIIHIVG